jgi:hypothetical protein
MGDHQLSRRERTILQTMEQALQDDDRDFVQRFDVDARRLDGGSRGGSPRDGGPRWSPFRRGRDEAG